MTDSRNDETQIIRFNDGGAVNPAGKCGDDHDVERCESRTITTMVVSGLTALVLMCGICSWAVVKLWGG